MDATHISYSIAEPFQYNIPFEPHNFVPKKIKTQGKNLTTHTSNQTKWNQFEQK